jgi:hypothetical protein
MRANSIALLGASLTISVFVLCQGCQKVHVEPGNAAVMQGESLKIKASVLGGPAPKSMGILTKRPGAGEWSAPRPMAIQDGDYVYRFEDVQQPFEYRLDMAVEGSGPFSVDVTARPPEFHTGEEAGKRYLSGNLADYRLVIMLHDIRPEGRGGFLQGFLRAFTEAGRINEGTKYATMIEGAAASNQYETAVEMGLKHARRMVTNSQVQNLIRSTLGISRSLALGWKAGYIQGFKMQLVSEAVKEETSISEKLEDEFYRQAVATYSALRAATGL